jgi:hypothetical protein
MVNPSLIMNYTPSDVFMFVSQLDEPKNDLYLPRARLGLHYMFVNIIFT